jgi:hypothetical protein
MVTDTAFAGSGANPLATIKSDREITQIIEKWHSELESLIDQGLMAEIDTYAAQYPLESPEGSQSLKIDLKEDGKGNSADLKPEPSNRDTAYALSGAGAAMLSNYEGYEHYKSIAFWCFVEAALLKLEPDYLSDIAFFLIDIDEYDDGIDLLSYAWSKDNYNYGILSNLAYVMALNGNFDLSVDYQKNAMAMNPSSKHIKNRLKAYAKEAGVEVYIPADKPPANPNESGEPVQPTQAFPSDYLPSAKFPPIYSKIVKISWNDWMQNIYNPWSKDVWHQVHGAPHSFENLHYDREEKNREEEKECKEACDKNRGAPGEDISMCICNCELKHLRSNLDSAKRLYSEAVPVYTKFRTEAHEGNEKALEERVKLLNDNIDSIYPVEIYFAGEFIQDNYLYYYEVIEQNYSELQYLWEHVTMAEEDLDYLQKRCNKLRMALRPKLKPEDFFAKPPSVFEIKRNKDPWSSMTIWFWYGTLRCNDDGSIFLDVTPTKYGVALKGKYNYKTDDWGAGASVDFGAEKLLKGPKQNLAKMFTSTGFTAFYDSKTGFSADVSAKVEPKIGYWGGEVPSVTIKIYH